MSEAIAVLAVAAIAWLCGYVYGWQASDDYRFTREDENE